jgi:endo-1,4-beta-mannosidase
MSRFVKAAIGSFILDGKPFCFVGANVYELANVEREITRAIIDDAVAEGFTVLRFWLFQNKETSKLISKLSEICDLASERGLKLIVSLSDKWGYLQNYKIDEAWYNGGYKKEYLSYVKEVTSAMRNRDEIMIWELINEPETDSFWSFYSFAEHVSGEIKTRNPDHLLSTGSVGGIGDKFGSYFSVFKKANFEKLYTLESLDAVSIHDYSYDSGIFERLDVLYRFRGDEKKARFFGKIAGAANKPFESIDRYFLNKNRIVRIPLTMRHVWSNYIKKDVKFAISISKPLYIGEVGFKSSAARDRTKILDLDITEKFAMGVSGYILWSFQAQGWSNDGHNYGFGTGEGFEKIVRKWNHKA